MGKRAIKPLKNIHMKDIDFFKCLSNSGHISREQSLNNLEHKSSNKRLNTYVKNKIIEPVATRDGISYKFTKHGKDYVKDLGIGITYFQNATSAYHDNKIAEKYLSISNNERQTWKNETQLREEFLNYCEQLNRQHNPKGEEILEEYRTYKKISIPDCCYVSETEETIIWEAITNSYGQQELEAKRVFANVMNMKIEFSEK